MTTRARLRIALVYRPARRITGPATYFDAIIRHLGGGVDFEHFTSIGEALRHENTYSLIHVIDIKQLASPGDLIRMRDASNIRFIVDIHDHYWTRPSAWEKFRGGWLRKGLASIRLRRYLRILSLPNVCPIVHSQFVAEALSELSTEAGPVRARVVSLGVTISSADSPRPTADSYLLFVGRDYARKGLPTLIEAFGRLMPAHPDLHLVVIGGEYLHSSIYFRLRAFRHRSRIHFLGELPNAEVRRYAAHARVLVQPSYMEASSISAMEAMSLGVPVVVSGTGGLPELYESDPLLGELIVPVGDSRALAACVSRIIEDEPYRTLLSAAARTRWQERFTGERMTGELVAVYRSISSKMYEQT